MPISSPCSRGARWTASSPSSRCRPTRSPRPRRGESSPRCRVRNRCSSTSPGSASARGVIPGGTYPRAVNGAETVSAARMGTTVIVSAAMSDDLAYTITKTINDNADRVRKLHPSLADYDPVGKVVASASPIRGAGSATTASAGAGLVAVSGGFPKRQHVLRPHMHLLAPPGSSVLLVLRYPRRVGSFQHRSCRSRWNRGRDVAWLEARVSAAGLGTQESRSSHRATQTLRKAVRCHANPALRRSALPLCSPAPRSAPSRVWMPLNEQPATTRRPWSTYGRLRR